MSEKGVKVLVCGGRDYPDQGKVWTTLDGIHAEKQIACIIEGGAFGADAWALTWGHSASVPVIEYKADWKRYGRKAGPIRNQLMLDDARPDIVVAFPGGRGTADMVDRAKAAGVEVRAVS